MSYYSNPYMAQFASVNRESYFFSDDFASDTWTDTGTNVAVSSGAMQFSATTDNTGSEKAFSGSISNTAYVMRYKLTVTTKTNGGNYQIIIGTFSETGANNTSPSQDFLCLRLVVTAALSQMSAYYGNGVVIGSGSSQFFATAITTTTWYVEQKRLSSTSYSVELFSDSGFSSSVENETVTISSGIVSMDNIKVISMNFAGGGALVGTVDDIYIKDGVTTW